MIGYQLDLNRLRIIYNYHAGFGKLFEKQKL